MSRWPMNQEVTRATSRPALIALMRLLSSGSGFNEPVTNSTKESSVRSATARL